MRRLAFALITIGLFACGDDGPTPNVPDAAQSDAPPDGALACLDPSGAPANCYKQDECEPSEDEHFLNGCTDAQCIAFDNVARLPLYNNGTLPPLP